MSDSSPHESDVFAQAPSPCDLAEQGFEVLRELASRLAAAERRVGELSARLAEAHQMTRDALALSGDWRDAMARCCEAREALERAAKRLGGG